MTLTAPLRTLGRNFGIRKWVDSRACPRDQYFGSIDNLRRAYAVMKTNERIRSGTIAALVLIMKDDELLENYLVDENMGTESDEQWERILLVAAEILHERYDQAVENKKWPKP